MAGETIRAARAGCPGTEPRCYRGSRPKPLLRLRRSRSGTRTTPGLLPKHRAEPSSVGAALGRDRFGTLPPRHGCPGLRRAARVQRCCSGSRPKPLLRLRRSRSGTRTTPGLLPKHRAEPSSVGAALGRDRFGTLPPRHGCPGLRRAARVQRCCSGSRPKPLLRLRRSRSGTRTTPGLLPKHRAEPSSVGAALGRDRFRARAAAGAVRSGIRR